MSRNYVVCALLCIHCCPHSNKCFFCPDLGFEELSPNKVATELFRDSKQGDTITILSRFGDAVEPYVKALDDQGFQARVISGQESEEDFCYLLSAQKELVGVNMSTFVRWAAFLGNSTRARCVP